MKQDNSRHRPAYRAEAEAVVLNQQLALLRDAMATLERCGLKGGKEYRRMAAEAIDLQLAIQRKTQESYDQHRECGKALAASFIAIDYLTEALDNVAGTFERQCVMRAKSAGLEYVNQCRKLAKECNHLVCMMAANDKLDEAFAETSERLLERFHALTADALERDEFKMLKVK